MFLFFYKFIFMKNFFFFVGFFVFLVCSYVYVFLFFFQRYCFVFLTDFFSWFELIISHISYLYINCQYLSLWYDFKISRFVFFSFLFFFYETTFLRFKFYIFEGIFLEHWFISFLFLFCTDVLVKYEHLSTFLDSYCLKCFLRLRQIFQTLCVKYLNLKPHLVYRKFEAFVSKHLIWYIL